MNIQNKVIFIFLDGVGLGKTSKENPIYINSLFRNIISNHLVENIDIISESTLVKGIDACLGVQGIPQSATGQTALFSGVNAAQLLGYHLPAYPNNELISIIQKQNIFSEIKGLGKRATFANAYRKEYFDLVDSNKIKHSVSTHSCLSADVQLRTFMDYKNHRAIFWDITGFYTKDKTKSDVPVISAELAGEIIADLSLEHELVVFESFLTDLIGHSRNYNDAKIICDYLNRFLESIIDNIENNTTIIVTSDHGNFEDFSVGHHTKNEVPLLMLGSNVDIYSSISSITEIPKIIKNIIK